MRNVDPTVDDGSRGAICLPSPSWLARLRDRCSSMLRGGRRMCGIPDYQTYLAHHRQHHPERPPLSFEAFFRERIEARYGGRHGNSRCC
jgi:uncharacterized short protein YbdD (DUF466 family)